METRKVYLLFLDTGTFLTKTINLYTRTSLNHASIALDRQLNHVYSFGRKRPSNPFIAGFIKENLQTPFFNNTKCAVYRLTISEQEYQLLQQRIMVMEASKHLYRYNLLGLFGVMLNKELVRDNTYFCSQFVADILQGCGAYHGEKPTCLIKPQDLREWHELELIYQGDLSSYPYFSSRSTTTIAEKWNRSNVKLG